MKINALMVYAGLSVALLSGCSANDGSVQAQLKELTQTVKPHIQPLPSAIEYKPFAYSVSDQADPFSPEKASMRVHANQLGAPDLTREKEVLESFPLDTMRVVGVITQKGVKNAVLSVNGSVYRVKKGNYLGQNFGKVTEVTDTSIRLTEMNLQPNGDWLERPTELTLQDTIEAKKK